MDTLRLEYDGLLEDMVKAQLAQAGSLRSWRQARVNGAVTVGVVIAVGLTLVLRLATSAPLPATFAFSVVVGGVFAAWSWFESRHRLRRHVEAMCAELRGTRGRVRVAVEMGPNDICMRWRGVAMTCSWPAVTIIDDAPHHVEITAAGGMTMLIPSRAFANDRAKTDFAARAEAYRAAVGGHWVRIGHRNCPVCEYDLFGVENDVCPECGTPIDEPAQS